MYNLNAFLKETYIFTLCGQGSSSYTQGSLHQWHPGSLLQPHPLPLPYHADLRLVPLGGSILPLQSLSIPAEAASGHAAAGGPDSMAKPFLCLTLGSVFSLLSVIRVYSG